MAEPTARPSASTAVSNSSRASSSPSSSACSQTEEVGRVFSFSSMISNRLLVRPASIMCRAVSVIIRRPA